MSAYTKTKLVCALLLAASVAIPFSGAANAAGLLSFDPALTRTDVAQPAQAQLRRHAGPVRRAQPAANPVTSPTEVRADCFWCGRQVYISGLAF
jgi:hypothetical protein